MREHPYNRHSSLLAWSVGPSYSIARFSVLSYFTVQIHMMRNLYNVLVQRVRVADLPVLPETVHHPAAPGEEREEAHHELQQQKVTTLEPGLRIRSYN